MRASKFLVITTLLLEQIHEMNKGLQFIARGLLVVAGINAIFFILLLALDEYQGWNLALIGLEIMLSAAANYIHGLFEIVAEEIGKLK